MDAKIKFIILSSKSCPFRKILFMKNICIALGFSLSLPDRYPD